MDNFAVILGISNIRSSSVSISSGLEEIYTDIVENVLLSNIAEYVVEEAITTHVWNSINEGNLKSNACTNLKVEVWILNFPFSPTDNKMIENPQGKFEGFILLSYW